MRWFEMFSRFPVILVKDMFNSFDLSVIVFEFIGHQHKVWGDELRWRSWCLGHSEILLQLLRMLIVKVAEDLRWIFVRALVYEVELFGAAKVFNILFAIGCLESRHQLSTSNIYLTLWKILHGWFLFNIPRKRLGIVHGSSDLLETRLKHLWFLYLYVCAVGIDYSFEGAEMCGASHLVSMRIILSIISGPRVFALIKCRWLRLSTGYVFLQLKAILVWGLQGIELALFWIFIY